MKNRFIEKLGRFATLDADDIVALERATAKVRGVSPRQDLIREGDEPGPVFVILEGWAFRYKILPNGGRQVLAYLMPGDSCDLHIGLLAEMDHSIQSVTAVRYATIDRLVMDEIMDGSRNIAKAMYVGQLVDEGIMRAWITSMGRRASVERVAHLMSELFVRARSIGLIEGDHFEMPLSQTMMADSLGMTAVHLNRVLKKLRLDGAMTISRGSLIVTNPGRLAQIAGFDENYLHRRLRVAA